MIGCEADIGLVFLQNVEEPMCELQVPIAGSFGLSQGLDECLVTNPVQFAGYGLKADVNHGSPISVELTSAWTSCAGHRGLTPLPAFSTTLVQPDGTAHRGEWDRLTSNWAISSLSSQSTRTVRVCIGSTAPAGIASSTSQSSWSPM